MQEQRHIDTVSLEDLLGHRVSATEAAALVAGVADLLIPRHASGDGIALPSDSNIVIDSSGTIAFASVPGSDHAPDCVPALASLLRRLLDLDSSARPKHVPGSLMVLMARALGEIDLPAPTLHEFRDALVRVAPTHSAIRAALVASRLPARARANEPPRASAPLRPGRQWRPAALSFAAGALATVVVTSLYDPLGQRETPAAVTRPAARAAADPSPNAQPASPVRRTNSAAPPARPTTTSRSAVRQILADVNGSESFSPSFSADGHAVYFHTGRVNGRLMRAELAADGSVARVQSLLADGASNFHAVPSPDGSAVAFDSDRDGVRAIYVADADGTRARRVSGPGFAVVPTWSPDGQRLAFVKADADPRTWNVWVADVATGELQQVSQHRVGQAWGASWFPDGRRIAYSREDQLVIVDLSTGASTTVRSPRAGLLVRTPSVSPDGTRVVFQVHGDGVWVLDVARGRISRVLTDQSAEEFRWSPDGQRIAYHARRGGRWGLWTISSPLRSLPG